MNVALVTGAGAGIGRQAAIGLAKDGFSLVLAGRRREPLDETARLIGGDPSALVVPCDVSEPDAVAHLFDQILKERGRLDLLFNNAGISAPGVLLEDLEVSVWQQVIATNLTGAFLCTREAFRIMKAQSPQGGRIINNGSISAHTPRPNSVAYTASKHAITGLTKSTALDGRKYHIACGQIDIGNADTAMAGPMKAGVPQAHGGTAIEPTMDVTHVVDAIRYMAGLPLDANVLSLTVMATNMPFVGRG